MSSAAKRTAALDARAEEGRALIDASAARTRPISVHLTPLAPGCAYEPVDSKKRWRTFYGRSPDEVMRKTLKRLRLAPGAVRLATENGDLLLRAQIPEARPGDLAAHAIFWDGLTQFEAQAVLDSLAAQGWRPDAEGAG